ncbi:hypothetical protein TREES_T100013395 [Tupaia chinensis]|uniref:Uncharacterized protein n=1 Tax=Tupaia chinensis TaxID=246437 RepID=L9JHX2_TUPCH|nr:hypothetical protein TREES_T100013395 [Tupaia chinensis]
MNNNNKRNMKGENELNSAKAFQAQGTENKKADPNRATVRYKRVWLTCPEQEQTKTKTGGQWEPRPGWTMWAPQRNALLASQLSFEHSFVLVQQHSYQDYFFIDTFKFEAPIHDVHDDTGFYKKEP